MREGLGGKMVLQLAQYPLSTSVAPLPFHEGGREGLGGKMV